MATNGVTPSQERIVDGDGKFIDFHKQPRFRQTEHFPGLVARGVLPFGYLELGERFSGCAEAPHVRDVLMSEGHYPRPELDRERLEGLLGKDRASYIAQVDGWKASYDKRRKAARERVKKRRARK